MQYSGYNKIITYYLRPYNKFTLGRFFESVPFASTGFTLNSLKILTIIQNYKIKTIFFSLFIFCLLDKYTVFKEINFAYSGLLYNIRGICLVFIFSLFSSIKITNMKIEKIIRLITNYTAGVYYMHSAIILYLRNIINPIKNHNLLGIFIIYLLCYLISFIGIKMFGKTKLKYLFS